MSQQRWQDRLNLVLGAWLFVTPFVVGAYGMGGAITAVLGATIVIVSAWALRRPGEIAPEYANVVLGACAFIAPFVLYVYAVAWMSWVVGLLVMLIAGTEIEIMGGKPTHA
jgi:hypothetical protein